MNHRRQSGAILKPSGPAGSEDFFPASTIKQHLSVIEFIAINYLLQTFIHRWSGYSSNSQ